jgi:hypothetical protein
MLMPGFSNPTPVAAASILQLGDTDSALPARGAVNSISQDLRTGFRS